MSNIKVAVRVRPISEREFTLTGAEVVVRTEVSEVALTNLKVSSSKAGDSRERTRRYGFDYCFDSSNPEAEEYATQEKIYETLGRTVLDAIFSGYNSCLVAYGQSASGKTYTMMGPKGDPGLTPRLCEGLFLRLLEEEKNERTYQTSVSYLEIYNERVRDLLKPSSGNGGLRVREHPRLGPYVQGLTHHVVRTLGSLMSYVEEGTKARKTASTLQNPSSSRSHALLTILLSPGSQSGHANPIEARSHPHGSRLHLVDLAGSESAATCSGIHRLKEGANINKSLVALGNVISALAERGSTGSRPGRRFIPYRDSALTWLLKDALGGNATTIMLATISPASGSYNETAHTLRFAQRAQSVVNRPVINEDPVARIIRELRAEVVRLKSLLEEKVVEADCKSICCCKQSSEEKKNQDQQTSLNYLTDAVSSEAEGVEEEEEEEERRRKELDDFDFQVDGSFTLHKPITGFRQYSSNESLIERRNGSRGRAKRFGSLELLSPSNSFEGRDCNRAEISELFGNEESNGPVFVDIPTLVAVLIKPEETSLQGHSAHIEEISSEAIPESPVDAEFPARFEVVRVLPEDVPVTAGDAETRRDSENGEGTLTSSPSPSPSVSKLERDCREEPEVSTSSDNRSKAKLRKQASVDTAHPFISTSLQTSKRFGSVEGLTKKAGSPGAVRRSHTNLERRSLTSDKSKRLNNIKEVEDRKSTRSGSVWRALTGCSGKDFQRKGSNDSDKSLRDSAESQKSRGFARKPNIDNLKRKTSKDSSSSSSREDQSVFSGQARDKFRRKSSLDQDHSSDRAHTQIHRTNRRAEIVAAVTQRLYSSKKNSEDNTANASCSDFRPSESSDVRMALATKMRFQEISRRMLAKRRRICVDTQTEDLKTLRVKDTGCLTDSQEILSKDVAILTDRHEDFENISRSTSPVLRVKEVATLTERQRRSPVRYKDVGSITDEHDEEYEVHSPRNDSGILSDDTQNYAESSFSSAADASELYSETLNAQRLGERSVEFTETSTNTVDASPETRVICSSAQTGTEVASVEEQKCHVGCAKIPEYCHHQVGQSSERNTISISLPDAISITIEMSNLVESSIAVTEGDEVVKGKSAIDRKDGFTQTEVKTGLERGTDTEDDGNRVCFNDFTVSSRPSVNLSDGKTFRIENIFQDPKCGARRSCPKIEIMPDTTEYAVWKNSLVFRNSVGTSFVPQTRERSTEIERENFQAEPVQMQFPRRASFTCRRSIGDFYEPRRRCNSLSPARRIFTWRDDRLSSVSGKTPLEKNEGTHPGRRDPPTNFEKKSEQKITSPEEEEECYMKKWERKNSRRGRNFSSQAANQLSHLQLNIADLKSPPLVASMDSRANLEQDPNFSDDSLDLNESAKRESLKAKKALALEKYKEEEDSCPPDVVAHTKKDSSKLPPSTRPEKEDQPATCSDFEENYVIEFPKTKPIEKIPASKRSQILDYKSLILGRNYFDPASKQDDVVEEECDVLLTENETDDRIGKKRVSFSISEVLGDELRRRIDSSRNGMTPKSIIKKRDGVTEEFARLPNKIEGGSYGIIGGSAQSRLQDFLIPQDPIKEPMVSGCDTRSTLDRPKSSLRFIERYCSSDEEYQNSRESLCKKVKFSAPESLKTTVTSDSDSCGEATVSEDDDEGIRKDPHDLLAEYFSEAATFMRNMNSMNEYMSANKLFERFLAKDQLERRSDVDKRDLVNDYLRQHRPCLPTPTSKNDFNYYPTDEDFVVSTESYEKCLKGLEKLESCIEKVERHSQLLQEKFEGDIDESADTKRDLVGNSIDSMKFHSGSTSGRSSLARKMQELNEARRLKSSLREFNLGDVSLPLDQVTSNDNFNFEDVMGSILDYPHTDVSNFSFRGSSQEPRAKYSKRMSDASPSKLRGRYGGRKRDSSSSSCDTSGVGNYLSPGRNDGSSSSRLRRQSARIPSIFADRTRDCGKETNRNGFPVEGGGDLLPRSSSLSPRRISRSKFILDNSTSSETAEASGGSINLAFAVGEKFKHPASPRAKFLQLLGERRRIVRSSRSTNNAY